MQNILLLTLLLPTLGVPFVYLTGKKSTKAAAILVALIAIADINYCISQRTERCHLPQKLKKHIMVPYSIT